MKIMWCSKYALTDGVKEHKGECENGLFYPEGWKFTNWRIGRDVHETRQIACVAAEKMRKKKIASLEKQIKRLKAISFSAVLGEEG